MSQKPPQTKEKLTKETEVVVSGGSGSIAGKWRQYLNKKTGLVLLGVALVVVGVIFYLSSYRIPEPEQDKTNFNTTNNGQPKIIVDSTPKPTAQQRHDMQNVRRTNGTIAMVAPSRVYINIGDGKTLELITNEDTAYSRGASGGLSNREEALKEGSKATLSYDKSSMVIKSIWVDYDQ